MTSMNSKCISLGMDHDNLFLTSQVLKLCFWPSTKQSHFSQESIESNLCLSYCSSTLFNPTLFTQFQNKPHKFRCILSITSLLAWKFLLISHRYCNNYHLAVQITYICCLLVIEVENPKWALLSWNQGVFRVVLILQAQRGITPPIPSPPALPNPCSRIYPVHIPWLLASDYLQSQHPFASEMHCLVLYSHLSLLPSKET